MGGGKGMVGRCARTRVHVVCAVSVHTRRRDFTKCAGRRDLGRCQVNTPLTSTLSLSSPFSPSPTIYHSLYLYLSLFLFLTVFFFILFSSSLQYTVRRRYHGSDFFQRFFIDKFLSTIFIFSPSSFIIF